MNSSLLWKKTRNGRCTSTRKDTRIEWYHERFQEQNDIPLKVTRAEWYQHGRHFINMDNTTGTNGITWKVTRME
jgi:hypothetical protein